MTIIIKERNYLELKVTIRMMKIERIDVEKKSN